MCNLSLGIEERAMEKARKELTTEMEKARKERTTEIIKKYIYKKFLSGASKEETKRDLREFFDLEPKEIENYISSYNHH